jgi:tetratricopeptide (TPR) repeat protein
LPKALAIFWLVLASLSLSAVRAQGPPPSPSVEALEHSAQAALQHGNAETAIRDYRLALAKAPRSASLHSGLGAALAVQGKLNDALDEQRVAVGLSPSDPAMHRTLGTLLYRAGDLAEARAELEPIIAANQKDLASALVLGDVYIKLGRSADAVRILSPLETAHQNSLELEYSLSFAMIQAGNIAEGAPRMEKVAVARKSADTWMVAGIARFENRQFGPARDDAQQALKLDAKVRGGSTLLGKSLYVLGQRDAAVAPLQSALRADPEDFDANLYLATIRLEQRDYHTAEALLDLALQIRPGFPLARLDRAKLLGLTGRVTEAVPILEDLVKGKPDWEEAHWELANDYFELNRDEDGRRQRAIVKQLRGAHQ